MDENAKKEKRKALLGPQLRCLVALYVGYLGVSLGADVFSGRVSGSALWLAAIAAIVFVGGAAVILIRELPKALKK